MEKEVIQNCDKLDKGPERENMDVNKSEIADKDAIYQPKYITIAERPNLIQRKKIQKASREINMKLEAKGNGLIKFFTTDPPKDIREIYEHDKQVINIINLLLTEIELSGKMRKVQETVVDEKIRETDHWKKQIGRAEVMKIKSDRRIRELEVQILKLNFTANDLIERKKALENRIRQVRDGWETYKSQVERDKRKAEISREDLMDKLKFKRKSDLLSFNPAKRQRKNGRIATDTESTSEIVLKLLSEKEQMHNDFLRIYSFNRRLYDCLERLKISDGTCDIDETFLISQKESKKLDEIPFNDASSLLHDMDLKFINLLRNIKSDPFGSDDTFRSKRIGITKQREIELLKNQLNELQQNYDSVVNTMHKWKEWKEDLKKI